MKKIYLLLTFIFLLSSFSSPAQQWYEFMEDEKLNFYTAVEKIETYFKDKGKGKGSGYKQFKRWEYEMSFHIDSLGNRKNPHQEYEEYLKFHYNSSKYKSSRTTASNWVELGPKAWNRTSSWAPGLGRVMAIAIHPTIANVIYIGTPGGGCWKTIDGGTNWAVLTDNFTSLTVGAVTIDPSNTNTIFIGCSANRLMKSTDAGATWTNSNISLGGTVRKIIVHPSNSSIVLTATSTGVYRSTNGGINWTLEQTGSFNDIEFKPNDPTVVYACGTSFYRSIDNGQSFTLITSGIISNQRSFISVTPANPNYVYMVMANGSEFGYLFRSVDAGLNFTTRVVGSTATATNYFGYEPDGMGVGGQAGYDMAMCVSETNAEEVHIGGVITWKSLDGGTSFTATTRWTYPNTTGYTHCDMHVLEYVNGILYTGSDGGIFKSTDTGDNFTNISIGLGIRQFYRIGCSKTNALMVSGGSQDNGTGLRRTANLTTGWIDWLGADGMETFFDPTNPNIVYGTSQNGSLYKSTNNGTSYAGINEPSTDGNWVTPFAIDPNVPTTLYVGYVELFKSTNSGTAWTALTALGGTTNFSQLDIAPSNSNFIYASKGNTIYRTNDGGTNWTTVTIPSGNVNYISVHPGDENKVVVATSTSRVYTTIDGGTTWINYTGTLPANAFNCAIYHNGPEDGIYVATIYGVYYRDNTLADWVAYSNSLPRVDVKELEIHYASGKIRAGTYGRGLWETDLYTDPLPVYYLNFNVKNSSDLKKVNIEWKTTIEVNNKNFEIERSHNGHTFTSIGNVNANGDGNSTKNISYSFIDNDPLNGNSYYRLAQYDINGRVHYTNIASTYRVAMEYMLRIAPNPYKEEFDLLISFPLTTIVAITITNTLGVTVFQNNYIETNSIHKLGGKLPSGAYTLKINGADGEKMIRLVKE